MKRQGFLIDKIADLDNLYNAYYKAKRGKLYKLEVIEYSKNLHTNINRLRYEILSGNVDVGNYHYFKIFDPKERVICAASFRERVLHHAIINICHEYFERTLIFDTYATRLNKGIYKALDKTKSSMPKYKYALKLDFKKYFDSISHEILKQKLATKFKDRGLLKIFSCIIDSYCVREGYGVPIGNLTSQYFANFYLSDFDHFLKEKLRIPFYVRYMDDILIMVNDKTLLSNALETINAYSQQLDLILKFAVICQTCQGVSFLGYKLFPHKILLNSLSKKRFFFKMQLLKTDFSKGEISQSKFFEHVVPLLNFTQYAYSKRLRKCL